jgi:hypothetical protein
MLLPQTAEPILMVLSIAFTEPSFQRFLVLTIGAILTSGPRTILRVLSTMGPLAPGNHTDYHRLFSRAPWSTWKVGKAIARLIIDLVPPGELVIVPMDDTVLERKGKKVYGKGCHRDAKRSSQNHTVHVYGLKVVVLSIVVKLPFCSRPWALPVLEALYRPEELNKAEGRRHKTPPQIAKGLMAQLMHWFPERKFVFVGDGGFASHELAAFAHRHRRRCALVALFHGDAALYEAPPAYRGKGRPRVKGAKLPSPAEVVVLSKLRETKVPWYGATERTVKIATGRGHWYRAGQGLVPVQWVFVRDVTGTRDDIYLYCTSPGLLTPEQIVAIYTMRWNIEVTFEEVRAHLGIEGLRHWCKQSVLRLIPCLFGLFSLVTLIYNEHLKRHPVRLIQRPGYAKSEPTFADALATVRELFWTETVFQQPEFRRVWKKIPRKLRSLLLMHLCQAV